MVNLGAITLSASINSEPISDAQLLNYYSVKRSGDGSNFITLTLKSAHYYDDTIIWSINVTSTIPDTYINNTNYGPIASYCVIGAAKCPGGHVGCTVPGAVKYLIPGNGSALNMIQDTNMTIKMQDGTSTIMNEIGGISITCNNGGGSSNPYNGVLFPLTAAYGVNPTTGITENFNYGTGVYYGAKDGTQTFGCSGPTVTQGGNGGALIMQYYWPPPITSDICFPAGTPVKTDQGLLPIEKLQPGINTINRNRIEHITRTITNDNYLVCFEKDSLDINLPIRRTLISKNHKILYKNKLIEAYKFIHSFHGVHKVEYNGELLYNVLMEDYYTMNVNNLICETLHPKNVVARLHNSSYSKEDKNKIICMLSETLKNKDTTTYKKMAMTLTSKKS